LPWRVIAVISTLALVAVVVHVKSLLAPSAAPKAPRALWRDGLIVGIYHCESPPDQEAYLACAELHCQAAIANQLSDPPSVKISSSTRVDHPDVRYVRLVGTIETREARSLPPQGYACELEGLQIHSATIIN
jgi:hypothetical protein